MLVITERIHACIALNVNVTYTEVGEEENIKLRIILARARRDFKL